MVVSLIDAQRFNEWKTGMPDPPDRTMLPPRKAKAYLKMSAREKPLIAMLSADAVLSQEQARVNRTFCTAMGIQDDLDGDDSD